MTYRLLYKVLHDSAAIAARVATRIYAENAPAGVSGEHIVMRYISGNAEYHLGGESDACWAIEQIDCHGDTAHAAKSLYDLVRNRLSGFHGTVEDVLNAGGTEEDVDVSEITIIRPGMQTDEPRNSSDRWAYVWSADFNVVHEQSVPTLT